VCQNSLDAVSDRDFAIEFTAAASLVMVHVSRLSEELILWMSQNFGFIRIADRFTTGSSIMPQKKNPDVPELARGKTGRVVGHLMGLITLMKGQPLAYNKDNQEDKEPLFDTVDTLKDTLRIFAEMIGGQLDPPPASARAASPSTPRPCAPPRKRATPPPPTWPTTWSRRACPSATRTRPWPTPSRPRRRTAATCPSCPGRAAGLSPRHRERRVRRAALRGSLNARGTLGGTAPAQVRHQVARHRARLAGEPRP
jgi:argininosuccinate lyase